MRIEGAWDTQFYQWLPAKPGSHISRAARLKGHSSPGGDAALYLTFLSGSGTVLCAWTQSLPKGDTAGWRMEALCDRAPAQAKGGWASGSDAHARRQATGWRRTPSNSAREDWRRVAMKRVFDFAGSLVALTVISPALLIVALLVRMKLGSPVLFAQPRPGLRGRIFTIWKFRTMNDIRDAEGSLRPDADRLTRFGRFLRSTSIDELPELWNVLRGDMSLVGPRPLLVSYLSRYSPEQARRHEVRPGLTGWAQINGRNATSWEDRLRLDTWYVDHRTMVLDFHILLRTVTIVLRRQGVSAPDSVTMPEFNPPPREEQHGKPSTPGNALQ